MAAPGRLRLPPLPLLRTGELALLGLGVFVLALQAGGLQYVIPRSGLGPLLIVLAIPAAFELWRTRLDLGGLALRNWPLLALVGCAAISWTWALDPGLSLTRVVVMLASFVLAVYGGALLARQTLVDILDLALSAMVGVSMLLALLVPSLGRSPLIPHHGESWSGLFAHRQYFAEVCSMAVLLWLYKGAARPRSWLFQIGRIVPVLGGLYLADSKTSLLACLMAMGLFGLMRFMQVGRLSHRRLSPQVARGVLLALVMVGPLRIAALAPLVPARVDRGDTLSGRTRMWRWGFTFAAERPWLGAGYHSFWGVSEVNYVILRDRAWAFEEQADAGADLENGHNGYFDVYFEEGLVGAAALGLFIVGYGARVVRRMAGDPDPLVPWCAAILAYGLADNAAETVFLKYDTLVWPLMMMSYLMLGKATAEGR
jgi:O-antigen ligase